MAKIIDTGMYEVVIVSPRNFFLFTPMLSGSAVGTVEFRSICEPIRQANPIAGTWRWWHCVRVCGVASGLRCAHSNPNTRVCVAGG